jgi:hypothetical protein
MITPLSSVLTMAERSIRVRTPVITRRDRVVSAAMTPRDRVVSAAMTPRDRVVSAAMTPRDRVVSAAMTPRDRVVSAADRVEGSIIYIARKLCVVIDAASVVPLINTPTPLPPLNASPPTLPQVLLIVSIGRALSGCPTTSTGIHVSTVAARLSRAVSVSIAGVVVGGIQVLVDSNLIKPLAVVIVANAVAVVTIGTAVVAVADVVVADVSCVAVSMSIPVRSDVRGQGTASPLVTGAPVKVC